MDGVARIILQGMEHQPGPLANSDNSYVMSLCLKRKHDPQNVDIYRYPNSLPGSSVFVDMVGWVPGPEANRYLTMGYRVWDAKGYRLHFHGTPFRYASVDILRYEKRDICSQPHDEIPDLYVQMNLASTTKAANSEAEATVTPGKQTPPWEVRLPVPEMNEEILAKLPNMISTVGMIFNEPHIMMARPCYTVDNTVTHEELGGKYCSVSSTFPLKKANDMTLERTNPAYPCIGVDQSFLSIEYPPTRVRLQHLNRDDQPNELLCSSCAALDFEDLFDWGMKDVEIDLGSDAELGTKADCSFCRIMGLLCDDGIDYLRRTNEVPEAASRYTMFALNPMAPFRALFLRDAMHCNSTKPYLVLNQDIHREYFGPVVSLRNVRGDIRGDYRMKVSGHVSYDVLRNMVQQCDSEHGPDCGRKSTDSDIQHDMILVDVLNHCLVRVTEKDMKYTALSYVWGKDRMFTTLKSNLKDLQETGALSKVGLCQTILDTIDVVRGLDVRYLWVDTLCIVQDDPEHKLTQIKNMAAIYGQAYLTIIALMGTGGNCALPGVSRARAPLVGVVREMPITAKFPGLNYSAPNRVYEQRAWTFQERIISRRCLYLAERQAFFECGEWETSDHEQIFPELDRCGIRAFMNPLSLIGQKPDPMVKESEPKDEGAFQLFQLQQFNKLVMDYSKRQMSYLSDIGNAFLGVQYVITQKCGWRFAAGLPIGIFDWALLWFPLETLRRRTWHQDSPDGPLVSPPSWSWFGWVGQVSYSEDAVGFQPSLQRLEPLVKSYVLQAGGRHFELSREHSPIWYNNSVAAGKDIREVGPEEKTALSEAEAVENVVDDDFLGSVDVTSLILHFEADAVSIDDIDVKALDIEWLSGTMHSANLRTSLLTGQQDKVMDVVNTTKKAQRNVLELVALSRCQALSTIRGGTWAEEKTSGTSALVIMLLRWQEDRDWSVAERVAIGSISADNWQGLSVTRKEICLV
ncbi:heterokaryon incompatibility protein-domain-containing protein [Clohesyomyces aquaticus]|uniref:Heterokaryon incompatibility protein-domain-containing protein n=1 Tax=Clohesyomyces aquaticus TaxID=1231657 RepID=A0A1Y1ZK55_9PLEO|nr:heterokaryon incompatibility protein-domain-containing protein [Clohesyomyces aquaticus]